MMALGVWNGRVVLLNATGRTEMNWVTKCDGFGKEQFNESCKLCTLGNTYYRLHRVQALKNDVNAFQLLAGTDSTQTPHLTYQRPSRCRALGDRSPF